MRIEGEYLFRAPQPVVFRMLQDPEALAKAMPGATELKQIGDDAYEAAVTVKVGPITGSYSGEIQVSEIQPEDHFRLSVAGKGAAGFLKGDGTIDLSPAEGGTLIRYAGETHVGGKIAQVGQRLIQSVARKMIDQGLSALETELAARQEGGEGGSIGQSADEAQTVSSSQQDAASERDG